MSKWLASEELVDESDATSVDEDTDDEESEGEDERHTDGEEDDEKVVTDEIMRVANAIEEEVEVVAVAVL